ncbi:MAG: peptide ABC transporter substrate-binding protein [Rhizobiales bacterium]|nr:peptide ABC transporter substrate-binding protein [Hyphomicrobiales bacterium]
MSGQYTGLPLGRRTLLKGAFAAGLVSATGFASARAASPKKGGKIVIATIGGAASDTLDPRTITSIGHGVMGFTLGNCLTEIGRNNALVGELAESWEHSANATVWKFQLRKGVTFHSGKSMTSEDVVYSLNLHRGEASTSGAKGLLSGISDIAADGPNAIVITMSGPNADVPQLLSDFHLLIVPAGTTDFAAADFTGPYKLQRFEPGDRLHAVRNPNYWKADAAHVDEVEILFVADVTARTSGLLTGEIHIAGRMDPKSVGLVNAAPGVHVEAHPGPGHRPLLMACDRAPFDNLDLRLAVKYSLDRVEILDKVMAGLGSIANDHPIPPFDPFHAADIPQRSFDPDKAKFHLKKSGFDGVLPLSTSNVVFSGAETMAALFQQSAAKAGLKVEIIREPSDGFWKNVWLKKPFVGGSWGGRATADIMLSTAYKSDAPWNDTHWKRADFDAKLAAARGETDFAKRKAIYHDLQVMIHEDGGAAIPFFNNNVDGLRDTVKGYYPSGAYELSGMRVSERVWLDDA